MRQMKIFVAVCAVFFIFLPICKLDGQETESPMSNPVNIIVILDTSNRISKDKHPEQAQRDIEIVKMIVDLFGAMAKDFIQKTEDAEYPYILTFVVPPEYGADPKIPSGITDKLTIEPAEIVPALRKQERKLIETIEDLYQIIESRELKQFPGSDIWSWFKYQADLQKDAKNRILCLSDGYLNFDDDIQKDLDKGRYMQVGKLRSDPNWEKTIQNEGLLETGRNFKGYDVKFMMIEIALKKGKSGVPYEKDFDIIKKYWRTWLKPMEITDPEFIQSNVGIPQLKKRIQSFIFPE